MTVYIIVSDADLELSNLSPEFSGRLVIPVGGHFDAQQLAVCVKKEDGEVEGRIVLPVRFVPVTGSLGY